MAGEASAATLEKSIRLRQAVALYIGAVMGSGILLVPGLAARIAGPASLLAWAGMVVLVFPMAFTMGLLSLRHPDAGGVAHFARLAFGPAAGAVVGWLFLLSVPVGAPVVAITGAAYWTAAFGGGMAMRVGVAALLLLAAVLLNLRGMRLAANLQTVTVTLVVTLLLATVLFATGHVRPGSFQPFLPHGWVSVGQAAVTLFWCFIGWEAVSHLSEEFADPERSMMKAVSISAAAVGTLYFLTAWATVATGSYRSTGGTAPLAVMAGEAWGTWGRALVALAALLICLATLIAYTGAASRLAYGMARSGEAPRVWSHLHPRYRTPAPALAALGLTIALVLGIYALGWMPLRILIRFPNATFLSAYLGACLAGIRLLRRSTLGRISSIISLVLTLIVFPFLGWTSAYPLAIALVVWRWRKSRPVTSPAGMSPQKD